MFGIVDNLTLTSFALVIEENAHGTIYAIKTKTVNTYRLLATDTVSINVYFRARKDSLIMGLLLDRKQVSEKIHKKTI